MFRYYLKGVLLEICPNRPETYNYYFTLEANRYSKMKLYVTQYLSVFVSVRGALNKSKTKFDKDKQMFFAWLHTF
jgi:hypothetical protein